MWPTFKFGDSRNISRMADKLQVYVPIDYKEYCQKLGQQDA